MEKTEEVVKILLCIILTYYFLWQRSLSAVVKSIIFSVNGASNPADLLHNNCPRFHWDTLMSQSKLFIVNSFLSEFSQYFNFFPNVVFYLIWRVSEEIDTTLWSVRHSPRMSYRHSLLKFKLHWHLPVSTLKNLQSPPLSLGPGKGISFFWCFFFLLLLLQRKLTLKDSFKISHPVFLARRASPSHPYLQERFGKADSEIFTADDGKWVLILVRKWKGMAAGKAT